MKNKFSFLLFCLFHNFVFLFFSPFHCCFLSQRLNMAEKMNHAAEALQEDEEFGGTVQVTHINAARPSPNRDVTLLPISLIHTTYGVHDRTLRFPSGILFDARFGFVNGGEITFLEIIPQAVVEEPLFFLPQVPQVLDQIAVEKGLVRGGKVKNPR